ncbi:hypothetical protein ABQJ54_09595 [Rhodanobacter sp. Si-c]|uniref:Ankyrin repeat domain-containing protein n=1 Tax=Rhodanobacter lycopersici TaxID=3162487 RepID=A0ABV3QDT5_9GAMM
MAGARLFSACATKGKHGMLARPALIVCALCVLQAAIAAEPAPVGNICRQSLPTIRALWRHDLYDAPPAVAAVMVEAIDGKLPQVRQGLAPLPEAEQVHWRQVAMLTAANAYQPAVVDGLLDDGAAVNEPARLPAFRSSFERQTGNAMAQDPRFGPRAVEGLKAAGVMRNDGNLVGPALPLAAMCNDAATLDVLLRHHADVMVRAGPNVGDALTTAVVGGHAGIVRHLLDHGADACADDRRIRKPGATLASIGRHQHLPEALLQRLTCHAAADAAP